MEGVNGASDNGVQCPRGTIAFFTVGWANYAFDVFGVSLPENPTQDRGLDAADLTEKRLSDGVSVNTNGHLVEGKCKEEILSWIIKGGVSMEDKETHLDLTDMKVDELDLLVYVTEREGCPRIAASISSIDKMSKEFKETLHSSLRMSHAKEERQQKTGNIVTMKQILPDIPLSSYLQDRPQIGGGRIVFVSTEQTPTGLENYSRQSWNAVYSCPLSCSEVVRLTPHGVTDYSSSVSPSGKWVAAASLQGKGWLGEIDNLLTDLYVFSAADGSERRMVVKDAGWPSWADESTIYFHREAPDGWWSVYRVTLPPDFLSSGKGEIAPPCRVTPDGLHAFTPSASHSGNWIAVATRRPRSKIRHVEIFDLNTHSFTKLTESIAPDANHFNPHVSASSKMVIYHRCRASKPVPGEVSIIQRVEPMRPVFPGLSVIRVAGTFPTFSPDGSLIAHTNNFDGVMFSRSNGKGKRQIFAGRAWGLNWDHKKKGVVYIGSGVPFAPEKDTVHILAISGATEESLKGDESSSLETPEYKILTKEGTGNNAFPAPSPDGKHLVFRSGRNGHKNLYIMDIDGEEKGIRQLTDGPWTDTMPNWSPDGQWIGFSSTRDETDGGSFSGYVIRPDGSGLRKIVTTGGGRVNHFYFSPDSQKLVFTSDYAAVSAEPISTPNQFQPYGDLFLCNFDGSGVCRLTHNAYENGTPCWSNVFIDPSELSSDIGDHLERNAFADQMWLAKGGRHLYEGEQCNWCR